MRRVLKESGHLGKTNWDAVIRVYDEACNVIGDRDEKESASLASDIDVLCENWLDIGSVPRVRQSP